MDQCAFRMLRNRVDPLVSRDDESQVDPSPSGQHHPFGEDLFQGFVEKGDQAPE